MRLVETLLEWAMGLSLFGLVLMRIVDALQQSLHFRWTWHNNWGNAIETFLLFLGVTALVFWIRSLLIESLGLR